jgi:hypothetical protein
VVLRDEVCHKLSFALVNAFTSLLSGKLVLGGLCTVILYAVGAPKWGLGTSFCAFSFWAFAFTDSVATDFATFQAAKTSLAKSNADAKDQ